MKHPSILLILLSGLAGPLAASEVLLNLDNPASYVSNTYTHGNVAATFATTGWDGGLRSYWQLGDGDGDGYGTSLLAGDHLQMNFSMAGEAAAPQLTRFKISYALDSMTSFEIPDASMNSLILQYFNGATYIGEQNLGLSTTSDFEQTATITTVPPGAFDRVRLVPGFSWTPPLVTQTDVPLDLDNEAAYANNTYTASNVSLAFTTDGWDGGLRSYWHLGGGSGFGYGTSLLNGQALKVAVATTEPISSGLKPISFKLRADPDFEAVLNSVQVSYFQLGNPVGGQTLQAGELGFGQSVVVNPPNWVDEIRVVPSVTTPPETLMFDLNNEASFTANTYSVADKRITFSTQGWDGGLRSYWQLGAGAGLGYGTSLRNGEFVQLNLSTLGSGTNLRIQSFKLEVSLDSFDATNAAVDSVTLRYYQGGVLVGQQNAGISTIFSSGTVTITPTFAGAFDSMQIQTALSGTPGEFSSISAMVVVDDIQFQSSGGGSGSAMIVIDEFLFRKTTESHVTPSMFLVVDDLVVDEIEGNTLQEDWRFSYYGDIANSGSGEDGAIAVNGLTNLQNFALDLDPTAPAGTLDVDAGAGSITTLGPPAVWVDPADGRIYLRHTRRVDFAVIPLTITNEFSRGLTAFEDSAVAPTVIATGTGSSGAVIEAVQTEFPLVLPVGGGKARFGRVEVTNP